MMLSTILIIGIIAHGAYGKPPSKLVNGQDSARSEFPYQASLRILGQHVCGGTIISDRHILTAAHCVIGIVDPPFTELSIITGTNSLRTGSGGKGHRVKEIAVHSGYVPWSKTQAVKNDIAVIALKQPFVEDEFQSRIALPTKDTPSGIVAIVSGWGRTQANGERPTILQKIPTTLLSPPECFEKGTRIGANQICGFDAEGIGRGVCKGDSGGPLVYDKTIVGIVSTSLRNCGSGPPDVYTRVFSYLKFIKDAMNKM